MKKRSIAGSRTKSARTRRRAAVGSGVTSGIDFNNFLYHDDSHNDTHGDQHQDQHGDGHKDHDDSPGHDDFGDSILDRFERFVILAERAFNALRAEVLEAVDAQAAAQATRIQAIENRITRLERR
jgi:hypothetical protein